jgi:hypothetical protein
VARRRLLRQLALVGRVIATAAALVSVIAAVALIGYGVLLWIAIPTSDTATSSLFLVGLVLVCAGAGLALLAWLLLRWGRCQAGGAGGRTRWGGTSERATTGRRPSPPRALGGAFGACQTRRRLFGDAAADHFTDGGAILPV